MAVTMADLAREAGVSQSTVSLALRNDSRLSAETKRRIQALAKKRHYQPDPALSALVAYRARTRPIGEYGKIAVLHDRTRTERWPVSLKQQIDGMREQANSLGYEIELFFVRPEEKCALQLSRMLYSRGIRGIILTAVRFPELQFSWKHFAAVVVGEYFSRPSLNHVKHHHTEAVTTTYDELRKLGYRKIGFVNIRVAEERKHYLYLGAYLKCLYLDGIAPASSPPFFYDENTDWTPLPWLKRHGFDAVMSMVPGQFLERLSASPISVPGVLGVAGYAIPAEGPDSHIAGCALDYRRMGAVAVDLLQAMLYRGQQGTPAENEHYDMLIRGNWRSGSTVRHVAGEAGLPAATSPAQGETTRRDRSRSKGRRRSDRA